MKTSSAASVGADKFVFLIPLSDAVVSSDFKSLLRRPDVDSATGEAGRCWPLYTDSAGRVVSGVRTFLNLPNYQVTISPDRRGGGAVALVQFSAGCNSETNLYPLGCDTALEASLWVRSDLAARGLWFPRPFESALLVRLDVASNVALNEPVAHYSPLFAAAGVSARQSKNDFGDTGFLAGNKKRDRWQLALYDKAAQMREIGYPSDLRPVNTLRSELRLLKAGVIRDRLGLSESSLSAVRSNWGALSVAHSETVRQQLFRHRSEADKPFPFDYKSLARDAAASARPLSSFASSANFCSLVRDLGLEGARGLLHSELASGTGDTAKHQRARIDKELDKAAQRLALWETSPSGSPMMRLYRELESKLLDV